ncbi:Uncharacterised protein [Escherichia coli]|nr:Uncharacterised protein [Escherichia coli]SQN27608.1 Uncharacterised protein [Escherichia coli]
MEVKTKAVPSLFIPGDAGAYSALFDHGLAAFFKVVVAFCNKITLCSLFFWIQVDF